MKKMIAAAGTALAAALMTTAVFADDIVVRTSIGGGEVPFTETSEAADISAEELTSSVKEAIKNMNDLDVFNSFLDTEASVTLKIDEENQMELGASVIGDVEKSGENEYASFFYSVSGFGDPMTGQFTSYHWVEDGKHYSAVSDGEEWKVQEEDMIAQALEELAASLESKEVSKFSLDALQPNLYQDESGNKYYVCLYDKDTIMNTANGIEGVDLYASLADTIIGDNDVKLIVVINADTFLPRAVSLDASGASGQLPGELFGAETPIEFSTGDLFATFLLDKEAQTIEIPEEVLNTPVQTKEGLDLDLDGILSGLGLSDSTGE